jgi:thioredoxin-like negative regulator of GroEL
MSSLVAWFRVTQKKRLRVAAVDVDQHEELVRALDVTVVPTLVLLRDGRVLDRYEGRATGNEIARMLARHVGTPADGKAGRAA